MKIDPMKILIIGDERKTGAYLRKGLSEAGSVTDLIENGEDGLHAARDHSADSDRFSRFW
jgi:two-component system, OmpR family, copper resistance phosphate regulon response regulator CusR